MLTGNFVNPSIKYNQNYLTFTQHEADILPLNSVSGPFDQLFHLV